MPEDRKPWPLHKRLQLEIGGRWQMLPDKNTTWRQWAFSPFAGLTKPGDIIESPAQFPPDIGPHFADHENPDKKMRAKFLWARCGVRVLGLDLGIGFFYRLKSAF